MATSVVILIICILVFFLGLAAGISSVKKKEPFGVYTSGADMRKAAMFTSTNQGVN